MSSNYYDDLQGTASLIASKLQGLSYLFLNTSIEGSGERDTEAHQGIGLILEDLAKESRKIDEMLDQAVRPTAINARQVLEKATKA